MSRSSSPQTTTTTSEPPKYLQPYLQQGLQQANRLYYGNNSSSPLASAALSGGVLGSVAGGSSGLPAAPVTPFSPETEQALQAATARATSGSPVNQAAQDYTTRTLSGGFMGSNPYLDATFNKAAGAVTNQIQSNFGLAGRNPRGADAAGFAADQYSNLATDIYGGDYQSERARQQQLVPFAGQLASQDYADIGQLANVGAQREALTTEYGNAPNVALDQYLARLSGFPGSSVTQTQPMQRNVLGGALGGASLGSMFGPFGLLGGGILGALYG